MNDAYSIWEIKIPFFFSFRASQQKLCYLHSDRQVIVEKQSSLLQPEFSLFSSLPFTHCFMGEHYVQESAQELACLKMVRNILHIRSLFLLTNFTKQK